MEIKMNAVNMVPVEWLVKRLTDSVDCVDVVDDLFDLFQQKVTDMSFGALVESILDHGFTTPICVQAIQGRFIQGNGHHRLAAALLMCLDEIPVYFTDDPYDYMCSFVTEGNHKYCDPAIALAWRKLLFTSLFDSEWCDEHNSEKSGCWRCYQIKREKSLASA